MFYFERDDHGLMNCLSRSVADAVVAFGSRIRQDSKLEALAERRAGSFRALVAEHGRSFLCYSDADFDREPANK